MISCQSVPFTNFNYIYNPKIISPPGKQQNYFYNNYVDPDWRSTSSSSYYYPSVFNYDYYPAHFELSCKDYLNQTNSNCEIFSNCETNGSDNSFSSQELRYCNERKTSVIMKIENKKIIEVKPEEIQNSLCSVKYKSNNFDSSHDDFICKWKECFRQFENRESLVQHVKECHTIHISGNAFFCKWDGCPRSGRGFNARYKILVHIRTHTKEKPHQCYECKKSFSRAENLKIHIRTHSGEKPYICSVEGCTKAYSNSSDRFKHSRTHLVEKPYICKVPGCNKRYTDPSSLRKHVKTFKHIPIEGSTIKNIEKEMNLDNNNLENSLNELNVVQNSINKLELERNRYILNSDYTMFDSSQIYNENNLPLDLSLSRNI